MIELKVVTPDRLLLQVSCDAVLLPGREGEFEVLSGHAPFLAALKTGIVRVQTGDKADSFMVADGFVEGDQKQVNILVDAATLPTEITQQNEQQMLEQLKSQLNKTPIEDEHEFKRLSAEIDKTMARLKLF